MKKLLYLSTVLAFMACNSDAGKAPGSLVTNPISAEDTAADPSKDAPIMQFDENIHDFGVLIDGEVVTYKFKFKNTGNSPLIISNAMGSCGCTIPSWPKEPVGPGEEGVIDVQFNSSGKSGKFEKNITITANTVPNQFYLSIRGDVRPKKD